MKLHFRAVLRSIGGAGGGLLSGRLAQAAGRSSGFDYLRVFLALAVVCWHSMVTSYGPAAQAQILSGYWRTPVAMILPMFFALSGFLVAGSLQRNTITTFLGLRVLRIVPALAVEVCLSALILGPLVTTLPFAEYFGDPRFRAYALNIVGDVHFFLPGVFAQNPFPYYVNGQLWTIPFELQCYGLLALMAIVGLCRRPPALLCGIVTFQLVWAGEAYLRGGAPIATMTVPGEVLPLCFLAGVALHVYRDRIPYNLPLALVALCLTVIGLNVPFGDFFIAFPLAYLTAAIGLLDPKKFLIVRWGDYSYGIFLYGFPIEQLVASWGAGFRHWYVNLCLSLPLSVAVAALSWNVVEKPALALRHRLRLVDAIVAALGQRMARLAPVQALRGRFAVEGILEAAPPVSREPARFEINQPVRP